MQIPPASQVVRLLVAAYVQDDPAWARRQRWPRTHFGQPGPISRILTLKHTASRDGKAAPVSNEDIAWEVDAVLANFMATPFLPGYNVSRLERQWDMPVPPEPSIGIEDARGRDEHRAMLQSTASLVRNAS